jgi:hypothetical protein
MGMLAPKVIVQPRGKMALYLVGALALVAMGLYVVRVDEGSPFWGWSAVVFFGLGALVFAALLVRPRRLLLDGHGFSLKGGLSPRPLKVAWTALEGFVVFELPQGGKMVGFNYEPEARPDTVVARMARSLGADGTVGKAWPGSVEAMVAELNAYRAAALAEGKRRM